MIYKRALRRYGQLVKIRDDGTWAWCSVRTNKPQWYNDDLPHTDSDDGPSCLLEVILLRPDLDYT